MIYSRICAATFIERLNRFVARVMLNGTVETVHVKNTGRCAELLIPGVQVWLEDCAGPNRITRYDLIAVEKQGANGTVLINMDSFAPNRAASEWLRRGGLGAMDELRAEVRKGNSRFDFYATQGGRPVFIEVKGCTLERDGIAMFPDAPTERGVKHIKELTRIIAEGCRCVVLIVVQMKGVRCFCPNSLTDPKFALAIREAALAGVEIIAMDCVVQPGFIVIDKPVPVDLLGCGKDF
ncbi:MAG: DNA/RNA nuclease SfsA [Christensenellales bacterium]|nr:DNA/RNA nuclease SfsA [Christensenellales bacterium]